MHLVQRDVVVLGGRVKADRERYQGEGDDAAEQDAFLRWMYLANIWGRYTGQTDSKLRRDVATLSDPDPTARLIEAIVTDRGRITIESSCPR